MISVITPTYNTDKNVLARLWLSLKNQTEKNWEWVVYDDSTTDSVANQIYGICSDERYRIRYYRPHVPSRGMIGLVKRDAFMLGHGDVLVELDHDDELTPDCLQEIRFAFDKNPDAGFVWSDCCELLPDGQSGRYPTGWAFGYGQDYWDDNYKVWAMRVPMNRTTLSHIVSVPNHVRAWRADVYRQLGGHNIELPIADDYELIVRTALETRCVHIPKMLYKQHTGSHTAQRQRNDLIQQLVARISADFSDRLDAVYGVNRPTE